MTFVDSLGRSGPWLFSISAFISPTCTTRGERGERCYERDVQADERKIVEGSLCVMPDTTALLLTVAVGSSSRLNTLPLTVRNVTFMLAKNGRQIKMKTIRQTWNGVWAMFKINYGVVLSMKCLYTL